LIFKLLLVLDGFWPTGGRWVHERRLADLVKSRFWWGFLLVVSGANIVFWLLLNRHLRRRLLRLDLMVLLSRSAVPGTR
jgi:hypothetical protein